MRKRQELQEKVSNLQGNITALVKSGEDGSGKKALALLEQLDAAIPQLADFPEEIEWDMLAAQSFITSVQTTTGYGDIVPVTFWGKFFTLVYAFAGIPIFMWYIVKLGAVFRLVIMKIFFGFLICLWYISLNGKSPFVKIIFSLQQSRLGRLRKCN